MVHRKPNLWPVRAMKTEHTASLTIFGVLNAQPQGELQMDGRDTVVRWLEMQAGLAVACSTLAWTCGHSRALNLFLSPFCPLIRGEMVFSSTPKEMDEGSKQLDWEGAL